MHARSSIVLISTALAAGGGLTACGQVDEEDKPTGTRPPLTSQLSAAITERGVSISPATVGGGPVRVIVSNQSKSAVKAVLAPPSGDGGRRSTLDEIAPGGVAAIQATLTEGTWRLRADGVKAATLKVSKQRESADSEMLLP